MHLSTEEPAASKMLEPFGEVGGDVPEYFSSRTHFAKIEDKKVISKIRSKNLTAGVFFLMKHKHMLCGCIWTNINIPMFDDMDVRGASARQLKWRLILRDAAIQVNELTNALSSVHLCMGWIGGRTVLNYVNLYIHKFSLHLLR